MKSLANFNFPNKGSAGKFQHYMRSHVSSYGICGNVIWSEIKLLYR